MKFNPPLREVGLDHVHHTKHVIADGSESEDNEEDDSPCKKSSSVVRPNIADLPTVSTADSDESDSSEDDEEDDVSCNQGSLQVRDEEASTVTREAPLTDLESFLQMHNLSQGSSNLIEGFASHGISDLSELLTVPLATLSAVISDLGLSGTDEIGLLEALRFTRPDQDISAKEGARVEEDTTEGTELEFIDDPLRAIHSELEQELEASLKANQDKIPSWHSPLVPLLSPKRARCPCPCCDPRVARKAPIKRQVPRCHRIAEEQDGEDDVNEALWAEQQRVSMKKEAAFSLQMGFPQSVFTNMRRPRVAFPETANACSVATVLEFDDDEEDVQSQVSVRTSAFTEVSLSEVCDGAQRPRLMLQDSDSPSVNTLSSFVELAAYEAKIQDLHSLDDIAPKHVEADTATSGSCSNLSFFLELLDVSPAYAVSFAAHGVKELEELVVLPNAELDRLLNSLSMDPGDEIILRNALFELRPDPEVHQTPSGCEYYQCYDNESLCGWAIHSDTEFSDVWSEVGGGASLKAWSDGCSDAGFDLSDVRSDDGSWVAVHDQRMVRTWSGNLSNTSWVCPSA